MTNVRVAEQLEALSGVPALPGRGGYATLSAASQSADRAGATYEMTVIVHDDGCVRVSCACPARKRCKHIDQVEQIYVNLGQAKRAGYGSLFDCRPALVSVPDDDDPFRGL